MRLSGPGASLWQFCPRRLVRAFGAKGAEEKTTSILRSQGVISHTL
jgi:hypothetical protein